MYLTTKGFAVFAKTVLLLVLACTAAIFLINGTSASSLAQSEERELENTVPKHLPIKVKIKKEKEKAFKDLKNEKWLRDFELEVTNTGDKPIYYLSLLIVLPEITIPNGTDNIGFSLHFGKRELYNIETKAGPDDISIKPGETYVFSFPEIDVVSWERFRKREHKPDAKKLILHFQLLSFGDGTGFVRNDGVSVPHGPDAKSSLERCQPQPDLRDSGGMKFQHASWSNQTEIFSTSEERELENTVPKHLPIKVKIKKEKEKAFKDLKNEKWLRDFELEVTNTGDKPIYYLSLAIGLPGITIPNGTDEMGFSLHFGKRELYNIETKAGPDDISIKPGETYVFTLSEIRVQNWERFRKREHKPDAKKLILYFQLLSFGDGTGFWGNEGMAVPHGPDAKSSLERCQPQPDLRDSGGMKFQPASWSKQTEIFPINDLPAESLLANLLSPESLQLSARDS